MWCVSAFSKTLPATLIDFLRRPAIRRSTPSERFFFYCFFSSSACSLFSSSSLSVRRLLRLRPLPTLLARWERLSLSQRSCHQSQKLYGPMAGILGLMGYHHEGNPGSLFLWILQRYPIDIRISTGHFDLLSNVSRPTLTMRHKSLRNYNKTKLINNNLHHIIGPLSPCCNFLSY